MSDNKRRKFMLKVDPEYYSLLKEYSEYTNKTEQYVLNQIIDYSLKEYAELYRELKSGYLNMGEKNLEISKEFRETENDAFNWIDD